MIEYFITNYTELKKMFVGKQSLIISYFKEGSKRKNYILVTYTKRTYHGHDSHYRINYPVTRKPTKNNTNTAFYSSANTKQEAYDTIARILNEDGFKRKGKHCITNNALISLATTLQL